MLVFSLFLSYDSVVVSYHIVVVVPVSEAVESVQGGPPGIGSRPLHAWETQAREIKTAAGNFRSILKECSVS